MRRKHDTNPSYIPALDASLPERELHPMCFPTGIRLFIYFIYLTMVMTLATSTIFINEIFKGLGTAVAIFSLLIEAVLLLVLPGADIVLFTKNKARAVTLAKVISIAWLVVGVAATAGYVLRDMPTVRYIGYMAAWVLDIYWVWYFFRAPAVKAYLHQECTDDNEQY